MNRPVRSEGGGTRTERDSFGPIEVPVARLWGAQTQRSLERFAVCTEKMPLEFVHALVRVKRAAALARDTHPRRLGRREAAPASGQVSAADFDRWVQPRAMLGPRP